MSLNPLIFISKADFAGGSLMSTLGIVMALFDRNQTGLGQIIDNSMVDSTLYLSSFILSHKRNGIWNEDRGVNILDNGSPFYKVYECGDGKFLCVAAIETLFYRNFLQGLGLEKEKIERMVKKQMDKSLWEETDSLFKGMIKGKGSKEWEEIVFFLEKIKGS